MALVELRHFEIVRVFVESIFMYFDLSLIKMCRSCTVLFGHELLSSRNDHFNLVYISRVLEYL